MKIIELDAGGRKITFSTKALTIDDKEYLYTGISNIKHSSQQHVYVFKYADKWCKMPYDPKNEAKLKALFGKIVSLNKARAAKAPKPEVPAVKPPAVEVIPEPVAEPNVMEVPQEIPQVAPLTEPIIEPIAEPPAPLVEEVTEETLATVAAPLPTVPAVTEVPDSPLAETTTTESAAHTKGKGNLKKSLIIFGAILAVFAIIGVLWFFWFGPSSSPNVDTNSNNTQQYNDLDELIDDLQE